MRRVTRDTRLMYNLNMQISDLLQFAVMSIDVERCNVVQGVLQCAMQCAMQCDMKLVRNVKYE